ncbi:putative nucleotide-binding protein [Trypanosoma conorhini]|uniref:Putative nucleotide-binding protein n=1 Tax=Trypanosoma conorhini TaxID=83891 RepID=A0A3R7KIR4_9TRYP|nr:putative nucleotide-binding protein [Trypanosoma conorhini]RNF07253.1 putative nucleotide-binding protein [Trypanosoma conorhini]
MQQMLVEQVFLMPTERQPTLLRQINRSRITLIFDDEADPMEELSSDTSTANDLTLPQYVVPSPVVYTLDGVTAYSDGTPVPAAEVPSIVSPRTGLDFAATATRRRSHTPEFSRPVPWQVTTPRTSEETSGVLAKSRPTSGAPQSLRPARPTSGFSLRRTPLRAASAGCNQRLSRSVSSVSRTSVLGTLTLSQISESMSTVAPSNGNSWTKSNSIDLSQKAKITASMFQSALDRYVKLDDQSYFQEMVRVCLPSQTEEQWFEEEPSKPAKKIEGLVLLLMHVRRCEGIEIDESMKSPIVKVFTNAGVLMRTPVMEDREEPVWPIEVASCINFVHADLEVHFTICDAEDEGKIAYSATLPTGSLRENGGVGKVCIPMHAEELGLSESSTDVGAQIEVCIMAVTASKNSSLKKRLGDEEDEESSEDVSTVYLQVLGVQGLKHRIEAVVSVSVESDGKSKEILRTPRVTPKTRTPSWPGQSSFCVVKSDGAVSFDLYHRDAFLASYDTPVDTLAFGGTGIYVFHLVRAQGDPGEVYGDITVSILGLKAASVEERALNRPAKVLILHVESLNLALTSGDFTPDPFVIVRGLNGEVILRTALNLGTYNAKWTEEEASCFIMCPKLEGATAIYRFEVYDNNESNKIGTAEMAVSTNGARRSRMQLPVGNCGALNLVAHTFPVQDVPRPLHASRDSLPIDGNEEGFLLSIHVSGCDNLQGTGFDDFQIDPLVTARVGRRRVVVAPLISGSTAPRWPYPKATFILPVLPELLNYVTLEVWDTNIELCDVLGVARVSVEELCRTGTHHFLLQPHKDQEFGRRQNLGTITVKTRFGRRNGEVVSDGSSDLLLIGNSYGGSLLDNRLFQTPGDSPELSVTRVRVHLSCCSALQTETPIRFIKATMSCLQHVLLEVKKEYDKSSSVAWSLEEAQVVVDLRSIYGRSLRLTVAGSSTTPGGEYTDIGSALVPFSTLGSAAPETISVRSFLLTDSPSDEHHPRGVEKRERSRSISVSADAPTITLSLFASGAARPVGLGGE